MCLPCMAFNFAKCLFDVLNRLRDAFSHSLALPLSLSPLSLVYLPAEICKSCWSSRGQVERTRLLHRLRKLQVKHKFHIFILHISLDNAAIYCTLFLCLSLSLSALLLELHRIYLCGSLKMSSFPLCVSSSFWNWKTLHIEVVESLSIH